MSQVVDEPCDPVPGLLEEGVTNCVLKLEGAPFFGNVALEEMVPAYGALGYAQADIYRHW
jgi:hypothetical protein